MRISYSVLTASDTRKKQKGDDLSGQKIIEIMNGLGHENVAYEVVEDDKDKIKECLNQMIDENVNLILTTGGTGFSHRDNTPEATLEVIEKVVPGIPEAMRYYSLQITKRAMLSRAVAGIKNNTLIVNMPGSPKAVEECLEYIISEVEHGLEILLKMDSNCARQ